MRDGGSSPLVFPDENPEARTQMQGLFGKMAKLEDVLRRHVEELRAETLKSIQAKLNQSAGFQPLS